MTIEVTAVAHDELTVVAYRSALCCDNNANVYAAHQTAFTIFFFIYFKFLPAMGLRSMGQVGYIICCLSLFCLSDYDFSQRSN